MRNSGQSSKNITFAAILWISVPAILFSYYYFIWLGNQQQFETNRKFRALDEMSRNFEVTLNSIPGIIRSDYRGLTTETKITQIKKNFKEKELRELPKRIAKLKDKITNLESIIDVFESKDGKTASQGSYGSPLKRLRSQQAKALNKLEDLQGELNKLSAAKVEDIEDPPSDVLRNIEENSSVLGEEIINIESIIANKIAIINQYNQDWYTFKWLDRTLLNSAKIEEGQLKSRFLKNAYQRMPTIIAKIKDLCASSQINNNISCSPDFSQHDTLEPQKKHARILRDLNRENLKLKYIRRYIDTIQKIETDAENYLPNSEDMSFIRKEPNSEHKNYQILHDKINVKDLNDTLDTGFKNIQTAQNNQKNILGEYAKFRKFEEYKKRKISEIERKKNGIRTTEDNIRKWMTANGLDGERGIRYQARISERYDLEVKIADLQKRLKELEEKKEEKSEQEKKREEEEEKKIDPYGIRDYTQNKGASYFEHFKYEDVVPLSYKDRDGITCPEKEEDTIITITRDNSALLITLCQDIDVKEIDYNILKVSAIWPFVDVGRLFDNYIQKTISKNSIFEGVLLVNQDRKIIKSYGKSPLSFANLDFLEEKTSSLLDIARTDSSSAEDAAEQELIRTGALSHSSLWQTRVGDTDYRLYIRPVEIQITSLKNNVNSSIGYMVGFEEEASFRTSISKIPTFITASMAIIIVLGLMAFPAVRLTYLKEWDAISWQDSFTTLICSLIFFSILTIAGLTLAHRDALIDKIDTLSAHILTQMAEEFREEVEDAYTTSKDLEALLFEHYEGEKTAYSLPNWDSDKNTPTGEILFPDCHVLNTDKKGLGWHYEGHVSEDLCSPEKIDEVTYQHPEFQEIYALTELGNATGNVLTNRRSLSAIKSLKDRQYFRSIRYGPLWNFKGESDVLPLFIQRIISRSEGTKITVVAKPSTHAETPVQGVCVKDIQSEEVIQSTEESPCFTAPSVIAQTRKMKTFWHTILPPHFEFAVIDNRLGDVIFHSQDHRSLVENFYSETDHHKSLKMAISARSPSSPMNILYRGAYARMQTMPLDNTPWSIILMYDKSNLDKVWLKTLSTSALIMSLFLIICAFMVLIFIKILKPKKDTLWYHSRAQALFWPCQKIRKNYSAVFNVLFLLALAQMLILQAGTYWLVLSLVVILMGIAVLYTVFHYYSPGGQKTSRMMEIYIFGTFDKYARYYSFKNSTFWLLCIAALILAVLPSAATFKEMSAYNLRHFEHYTIEYYHRSLEKRKEAIFQEAKAKSLVSDHFKKPPDISAFHIFPQGQHSFFAFDPDDPYEVDSRNLQDTKAVSHEGASTDCSESNSKANVSAFNFFPAILDFLEQSGIGSLKLPHCSNNKYTAEIPLDLKTIFSKSPYHFLLGLLSFWVLLWASGAYLKILDLHLFGRRLPLTPLAKGPKRREDTHYLIIAPTKEEFRFEKETVISPEKMSSIPYLSSQNKTVYLYNIESCLIDQESRKSFLKHLEKYTGEKNSVSFRLCCKLDMVDFLDNPHHYPDLILSQGESASSAGKDSATGVDAPPTALSLTKDQAQKLIGLTSHELSRWRNLLTRFETCWVGLENTKTTSEKETESPWPEVQSYVKTLDQKNLSMREKSHIIVDRARTLFEDIWDNRSFKEKIALYHLSNGDLLHVSAKATLLRLAKTGIVGDNRPYAIKCPYFAHYIQDRKDIKEMASHVHEKHTSWKKIRIPLLVFLLAFVIFIVFVGGKNIMESIEAVIGLFGAFIALAFRFLPFGRK